MRCFASHQQDVPESPVVNYRCFPLDLIKSESLPVRAVRSVETAVAAAVGTDVGEVERRIHKDGVPEPLQRKPMGLKSHFFDTWAGGRGEKRHKVVDSESFRQKGALHILCIFGHNAGQDVFIAVVLHFIQKAHAIPAKIRSEDWMPRPGPIVRQVPPNRPHAPLQRPCGMRRP